jgi:nucleoside-diphosphate-sugar epimerase
MKLPGKNLARDSGERRNPLVRTRARTSRNTRIYLVGRTGLVGGAILGALSARGHEQVIVRSHRELDLTDQSRNMAFFSDERPETVTHRHGS